MTRNIRVEKIEQTPLKKQEVEIVERKGIGHPDSMADGFAEAVSRGLSNEYQNKFGTILHHNTDQVEVVAGRSSPKFGGGELISPMYVLLVGRATKEFDGIKIPTDVVALKSTKDYLREVLGDINPDHDIIVDCKLGEGSTDLRNVFHRSKIPMANDTSFGVGHAPFSELENIVFSTERHMINDLKPNNCPAIGTDIKVMGMRDGDNISLTVACAMIDKYVYDIECYKEIKYDLQDLIYENAMNYTNKNVEVFLNTGDNYEKESVYLTVTGTSAEMGDDGSVGRGNRCNGLITPNRPMSMEATSGKNPINHIGKIYNLLSTQIARDVVENVGGIEECYIRILSQIGQPIDHPFVASAHIIPKNGTDMEIIKKLASVIINDNLLNITDITEKIACGKLDTF
jgi:S-adenosylmethionine synthetase